MQFLRECGHKRGDALDTAALPEFDAVHAPIAYWAARTPHETAIDDGSLRLSFQALSEQVHARASALRAAPSPIWIDDAATPGEQLIGFLAANAAGHAAAIGDPDWSAAVRRQVMEHLDPRSNDATTRDSKVPSGSFYLGFTSGSTGLPKGFVRSHRSWTSSFQACLDAFGSSAHNTLLAPGRLSHSLFLFGALLGLWTGAGVRLQTRFAAAAALKTLLQGHARSVIAVPSQLIVMLEHAQRHGPQKIEQTQLVMIGGAPWPRARTPQLQALFPNARIVEFYGASETSFIAWTDSRADLPPTAVGKPFPSVDLHIAPMGAASKKVPPSAALPGLIYVRSPMLFTGYATPTPAEGPTLLRDGEWVSVGDMGHIDSEGLLHLAGRQQRMFVAQGKNLFPEEVEQVLTDHPSIASASVQAASDAVRGMRAVAVLEVVQPIDRSTVSAWCRERLEPYKTPRRIYVCANWPRTTSGKTDHALLARRLADYPRAPPEWELLPWRRQPP